MKPFLIASAAVAVAALMSSAAFANDPHITDGTGGSTTSTNTNTNDNRSAVKNSGNSSNTNANTAKGGMGGAGGSSVSSTGPSTSTASTGAQSQSNGQSVSVPAQARDPVSTAYAPGLTSGVDTCMGSSSVGGQAVAIGLSLGSTWHDENCERLKNSRELNSMGLHAAALALLCQDDKVAKAIAATGHTCPGRVPVAAAVSPPVPSKPAPLTRLESCKEVGRNYNCGPNS